MDINLDDCIIIPRNTTKTVEDVMAYFDFVNDATNDGVSWQEIRVMMELVDEVEGQLDETN